MSQEHLCQDMQNSNYSSLCVSVYACLFSSFYLGSTEYCNQIDAALNLTIALKLVYMHIIAHTWNHTCTSTYNSQQWTQSRPSAVTAFPLNALMASGNRCLRSWPSCVEEWVQLPVRRGVKTNLFLGRQGLYQTIQTYDIIIFHHISGYWSRAQKANAPVILPYSLSIVFLDMRKASLCAKKHAVGTILHFCSSERIFFLAASTCMSLRTGLVKTCVTRCQAW